MDEVQPQYEKKDSIVLKRNAKGEYEWDVKLYWNRGDADTLCVVYELQTIDEMLREVSVASPRFILRDGDMNKRIITQTFISFENQ